MHLRLLLVITALSMCALLGLSAYSSPVQLDLATPTDALKTQLVAMHARDVAAYEQTLTRQTVQWLEAIAKDKHESVDEAIKSYLVHGGTEGSDWPSQTREEKLADGRVDVWMQINGQWSFVRFANEDGAWKMDGFGWPYRQPPQWVKQSG